MVLVGESRRGRSVVEVARAVVEAGAPIVQLRMKDRPAREVFEAAVRVSELCRDLALLIVDDRPDIAVAAGADGVHVGQDDLPPEAARRVVGPGALVGLSVHDAGEAGRAARAAAAGDVDYAGVGTVFPSGLKPGLPSRGIESLRAVLPLLGALPAFAIGGITAANVGEVLATGIHGVAVGSAIVDADDPEAATREMLALIREARGA